MASELRPESTSFTFDSAGRFLCNTLQEAEDSVRETLHGHDHPFDVIVVGGGTFGAVIAHSLLALDPTNSRRILVLESGPYVIPEHIQNMAFGDPTPQFRAPWEAHPGLGYSGAGLLFAIGGRSLKWGGWSPELLHDGHNDEMAGWPPSVISALQSQYFHVAGEQIGVNATNDFIFGPLHTALRQRLFEGLGKPSAPAAAIPLSDLPESPVIRAFRLAHGAPPTQSQLRAMLGVTSGNAAELLDMIKLEAPLAVESATDPGLFPGNKFSAVPLLTRAARTAADEAAGAGAEADARKRLLVVGSCHVQELITETQTDNWVRVTGVRAIGPADRTVEFRLRAPEPGGRQGVVILAAGTIESTRVALTTFRESLAARAAQRMGRNLMAHLRSNLSIRIPKSSFANLPSALQASALFVKAKTRVGSRDRYFHLQITASGLGKTGTEAEAELFKKIPDVDTLETLRHADDQSIVLVLRGIGEMSPQNPDSNVTLTSLPPQDFFRERAQVSIGNARESDPRASQATRDDNVVWNAMDDFAEQVALIFANGGPFELLIKSVVKPMAPGATAADIRREYPISDRRDTLGSTHHEAGTLWMGDAVATSVTNEFGRIHDTTNAYAVGPALFPSTGSPNPMLTGVALARRTAKLVTDDVLRRPISIVEPQFRSLFDGTRQSFQRWRAVGGGKFDLRDGVIVTRPVDDLGLLFFPEGFDDFELRLELFLDRLDDNSGVFVRSRQPLSRIPRRDGSGSDPYANPAYVPVDTGFEIQIDELARGDTRKGEPDGMDKKRTGAIYDIPTTPGWVMQDFRGRPRQARLGQWNDLRIRVQHKPGGDEYAVDLNGERVTTYLNTDAYRGVPFGSDQASGIIGLQSHSGRVGFRNVRIRAL